jgi:hypothetical protein
VRSLHLTRPGWAGPLALVTLALLAPPSTARAQGQVNTKPAPVIKLKQPIPFRVHQRDRDGKADIAIEVEPLIGSFDVTIAGASFFASDGRSVEPKTRFEDGKLLGVPTGGPYIITVDVRVNEAIRQVQVQNVFVGDLWVLAGQSNMQGVGDLLDVTPPNPRVQVLGMNGKWSNAEEPLHWLVDSPDPVHSGDPSTREKRSADEHKHRAKGAGLGLPFASALVNATGVPIGLIATAHGGTSMAQWDPAKKDDGGTSLYGSMLGQIKLAGGKVKGLLWYQGESDAMNSDATKAYPKAFADFIAAVRSDLHQPELPFYYVQIGRYIRSGDPKDWNAVQDAERLLAERVPNTAVVAVVDLELDDLIHVGTQGLKRAGQRLAKVALRELFGQAGATTPTFDRVNKGSGNTLVVKFKGVNISPERFPAPQQGPPMVAVQSQSQSPGSGRIVGLKPARHIAGFSIRKEDGGEVPLIFDAAVGNARDTVLLKLAGPLPEKVFLWYGYGFDPYCNLTDALDMAVPVFGPIALDDPK